MHGGGPVLTVSPGYLLPLFVGSLGRLIDGGGFEVGEAVAP